MTAKHPYPAHVVEAVAKALWETAPASQVIGWDDLAPQDSQHSDYTSKANTALNALWESDNHAHTPIGIHQEVLQAYIAQGGTIERFYEWFDATQARAERRGRSEERENIAAAEQRGADKAIAVFEEMSDDMGEAIAFDVLTTPHGEAEYPVSHFREKLQEAINDATDQTRADQEGDDE